MQLLERYRALYGPAVKRQGNGWNGPCPLCGGDPGKSDRFMVWPERNENLGETCAKHGIAGIWACRKCGESGDTIAYLMKVEELDFKAALAELGIEGGRPARRVRKAPAEPRASAPAFAPKDGPAAASAWSAFAEKLVAEGKECLPRQRSALDWLARRGIDIEACARYRLGYLAAESEQIPGRFRARAALGLAPKQGPDGKLREKLFIPRGILIPTFSAQGRVINLRIRRPKPDLTDPRFPKYLELSGSARVPYFLPAALPAPLAVYFVVEAELDAILIHHVSGGVAGAIAVRTNRGKPDAAAHAALKQACRILIALDYDEAGRAGCDFWTQTYPQAMRWPTPEGKDPGDAFGLGVNIRDWIEAALPASVQLPAAGQADTLPSGKEEWGKGREPETHAAEKGTAAADAGRAVALSARARLEQLAASKTWNLAPRDWLAKPHAPFPYASEADFTPEELCALNQALPPETPLDAIYLDVAVIWLSWRHLPVTLVKIGDAGFSWESDYEWRAKNGAAYERFYRLQAVSQAFWEWISDHPAKRIGWQNLLKFYEFPVKVVFEKQGREPCC